MYNPDESRRLVRCVKIALAKHRSPSYQKLGELAMTEQRAFQVEGRRTRRNLLGAWGVWCNLYAQGKADSRAQAVLLPTVEQEQRA